MSWSFILEEEEYEQLEHMLCKSIVATVVDQSDE
jgi:hypothetical protein